MNFGTVRSIAEIVIKMNERYALSNIDIIPSDILDTEVTDGNYSEIVKRLDEIRHTRILHVADEQFLFNVAAAIAYQ